MSEAVTTGHMPLPLRALRQVQTCGGPALVVGLRAPSAEHHGSSTAPRTAASWAPGAAERALAALLGEREADGARDATVVLRVGTEGNLSWLAGAISWLAGHGRRAIVRTSRVLPRAVTDAARRDGAAVHLQVASFDPAMQRALLGAHTDAPARLLLAAQHLRAQAVPVSVLVGPLLPVVHADASLSSVCRHIAAADLQDVSFGVGRWSVARHDAITPLLPSGSATALARVFQIFDPHAVEGSVALPPREASLLHRQACRIAQDAGLRVDHCGCTMHCHAQPATAQPYRGLLANDLFAGVG
ncbi:MAG: hypothetical protein AAGA54_06720 [Myxococcota bacterium]